MQSPHSHWNRGSTLRQTLQDTDRTPFHFRSSHMYPRWSSSSPHTEWLYGEPVASDLQEFISKYSYSTQYNWLTLTCDCHVTSTHSEACHTAPQCRRDGRHMYHKCSHRDHCCRDCHMGCTVQGLTVMKNRKKDTKSFTTIQCRTIHKINIGEGCTRCYSPEKHPLVIN